MTSKARLFASGVPPSGVTSGTYGSAASVPVVTVNSWGQVTNIVDTPLYLTSGTQTSFVPTITSIQVTDSSYVVTGSTSVDTTGGYIVINGTNFDSAGSTVEFINPNNTITLLSNVSTVGTTQLRMQIPALLAGTYSLIVTGVSTQFKLIIQGGLFVSVKPLITSPSSLGTFSSGIGISYQLTSQEINVIWTLKAGSSLPTGVTLSSSGLISGTVNVTTLTTYSFTIVATDPQNQQDEKQFSFSIDIIDNYFSVTNVLMTGNMSNKTYTNVSDLSANKWDRYLNTAPLSTLGPEYQNFHTTIFHPFQNYWSTWFCDDDYINITDNANLRLGNTFTIECWIYRATNAATERFIISKGTTSVGWQLSLSTTFYPVWTDTTTTITGNILIPAHTWTHIAVTRDGTGTDQFKMYVNGQLAALGTSSGNFSALTNTMYIGMDRLSTTTTRWIGGIFDLRINTDVVYPNPTNVTSAFTSPSATLSPTGNTVLHLCNTKHHNTHRGTYWGSTITVVNTSVTTRDYTPFYETNTNVDLGSTYFENYYDQMYILDTGANNSLRLRTNVFTIECWVYMETHTDRCIVAKGNTGRTSGWELRFNGGGDNARPVFTYGSTDLVGSTAGMFAPPLGWHHIAVVREGTGTNQTKLYLNGFLAAVGTVTNDFDDADRLYIGARRDTGSEFRGYLTNLRISNTARYTTASVTPGTEIFTPPITNFTTDVSTVLLMFVGRNNHKHYPLDIGRFGGSWLTTPYWVTPGPTLDALGHSYSVSTYGDNEQIDVDDSTDFDFGTGDFTIEIFLKLRWPSAYPINNVKRIVLDGRAVSDTNDDGLVLLLDDQMQMQFGTRYKFITCNVPLIIHQWHHVMVTRCNGKLAIYLDGQRQQEINYPDTINCNSTLRIGSSNGLDSNSGWYGHMSNLRICRSAIYNVSNTNPATIPVPTSNLTTIATCVLLTLHKSIIQDYSGTGKEVKCTRVSGRWDIYQSSVGPFHNQTIDDSAPGAINLNGNNYLNLTTTYNPIFSRFYTLFQQQNKDWTIEFWHFAYLTDTTGSPDILYFNTNGPDIVLHYNGTAFANRNVSLKLAGTLVAASTTANANFKEHSWNYWVIQFNRASNLYTVWVNGNRIIQASGLANPPTATTTGGDIRFGGGTDSVGPWRLSSTARYSTSTTTITVPTAAHTVDEHTLSCVNFDYMWNTYAERSYRCSYRGEKGNPRLSYLESKFNTSSIYFPQFNSSVTSTTGYSDYIHIRSRPSHRDHALSHRGRDFTVELWAKSSLFDTTSTTGQWATAVPKLATIIDFCNAWRIQTDGTTGVWQFHIRGIADTTTPAAISSNITATGEWQHFILQSEGGTFYFAINGVLIGTVTSPGSTQSGAINTSQIDATDESGNGPYFILGSTGSTRLHGFPGWINDFRYTQDSRYVFINNIACHKGTSTPFLSNYTTWFPTLGPRVISAT